MLLHIQDPAYTGKVQPWRLTFNGPTKEIYDRNTWYWCDHGGHKDNESKEVPIYFRHQDQADNDKWIKFKPAKVKSWAKQKITGKEKSSIEPAAAAKGAFLSAKDMHVAIKPELHIVLMTEAGLSDSQFDAIWSKHGPAEK